MVQFLVALACNDVGAVLEGARQTRELTAHYVITDEELTKFKAQEVGCPAYAGEGWQQWRSRISQKIKQLEEQL